MESVVKVNSKPAKAIKKTATKAPQKPAKAIKKTATKAPQKNNQKKYIDKPHFEKNLEEIKFGNSVTGNFFDFLFEDDDWMSTFNEKKYTEAHMVNFDQEDFEPASRKANLRRLSLSKSGSNRLRNLILGVLIMILVMSGFWAPQIANFLKIPINPEGFVAESFENPEIVKNGITSGELVLVRLENGSKTKRIIHWVATNEGTKLETGDTEIPAMKSVVIAIDTSGTLSGTPLKIYASHVKHPLSVEVY